MVSKGGCVGWMKKRTNLEKTLLSLSTLLLITLLLMILIGITYHGKKTGSLSEEDEVCMSTDCIKAAGDVLSSMEPNTESCSNFYDFACGNYGQEPGHVTSVAKRTTESVYFSLKRIMESDKKMDINGLDDMKSFYNSCVKFGSYRQDVDETGESLLNLMTELGIGIWPIIDPLYDTSKFSLEHTLVSLILLDVPVIFKLEIVPDEQLIGSYLIKISPGGPRETGRSPIDIRSDVHVRSRVLTSFLLIGASAANTDVYDILSVDSIFAAIEQEKSTPCDDVATFAPQEAISELKRLIPEIYWDVIISEIRKATGLRRPLAVKLQCKQKIRDYIVHLNDLSVRSVTNYLGWRFFSKFVEHVIPTFEKSQFGSEEVVPRWRVCLELMEKFASPILAGVLTQKMINNEIQDEVERISNATLSATQRLISETRWLNNSQKSRVREQVARIRIRYPFEADSNLVPVQIPQVDVSNFTAVVIQRERHRMIEKFQRLNQEAKSLDTKHPWNPVVSARSGTLSSEYIAFIYFDQIRNPYLRMQGSKWLNYGGFGVSIAREISKILISMSSGKSEEGSEMWNVWYRLGNSITCVDKSFVALYGRSEEIHLPEMLEKLVQDIFLDLSSMEIAYETASTLTLSSKSYSLPGLELSNEKIFFLSYAQTLCDADPSSKNIPIKDRLNSAVLNSEKFNEVFKCDRPLPQCQIWS